VRPALVLAVLLPACSSATAPERSASTNGSAGDVQLAAADGSAPAPIVEAPSADDVTAAALLSLREGACPADGATARGTWCGLLARFAAARAPAWQPGTYPGVVVDAGGEGAEAAQPALLAVRRRAGAIEVAWGALSPGDPAQATERAAMAADVLAGRAPTLAPAAWPGMVWSAPVPTRGTSAQLGSAPRMLAREEAGKTLVLAWFGERPVLAVFE
jgi:hypothetical protein